MNAPSLGPSGHSNFTQSLCKSSQLSEKVQRDLSFVADQINHALEDQPRQQHQPLLSFVIPAKDEQETLSTLASRILSAVPAQYDLQFIWIDDGSEDATWQEMQLLASCQEINPRVTVEAVRFRHNVGKAAALTAGFRLAKGDIVFTMDADLQDDPQEIPRFLAALESGFDVVTGWKKTRHDPWHKVLPSRVFNFVLSRLTGVKLHDHNCGFKCYRGEVARKLAPHGELHRMMPTLASLEGYRTTEIEVQHHPRRHGQSKYGWERLARGFSDMLTMSFLKKFGQRPSHFINLLSGLQALAAFVLLVAGVFLGLGTSTGWMHLLAGGVLFGLSLSTFVLGLLAEMTIRDGRLHQRELPISEVASKEMTHLPCQQAAVSHSLSPFAPSPITTGVTTL